MTVFGSIVGGVIAAIPVWFLARMTGVNLPAGDRVVLTAVMVGGAVIVGVLVGGAVLRRAWNGARHICMFSTVATGFGVGTICALCVAAITASYLASFGQMPPDLMGRILYVLAVPAFSLLGWFVGALLGACLGLATGTVLRGLASLRR